MPEFLNVLHVYTVCESELDAIIQADDIKVHLERKLLDEGESVDVVQTIPISEDPAPSASVTQLRRARNILLRTKTKENYDIARMLDQAAWIMYSRTEGGEDYDWSKLMEVMRDVLRGENPLEY